MKHVLFIEDDLVLRDNTAELLELSGYKVTTASNGKEGVEIASNKLPDIIVCDIIMPELDGYGVLNTLAKNKNTKFIPFIYLSAKTKHQDVRKGMNLGADDYITKPFSEDDLIGAIESRLAKVAILKESEEHQDAYDSFGELKTLNDLKNFFDDNGKTFVFNQSEHIYKEGSPSNYIYLIVKGAVKCFKLDEQGKELTTSLYKEDQLFGYTSFTQNMAYQETATAIKDTELIGVSKEELMEILKNNHKVTLEIIQLLSNNLSNVKEQLLQMAYSTVNKKTAASLIKFAEKLNRKQDDQFNISRSDLASVAGIATETLIRTMTIFKKQGLIDIIDRNIKILDINGLRQML